MNHSEINEAREYRRKVAPLKWKKAYYILSPILIILLALPIIFGPQNSYLNIALMLAGALGVLISTYRFLSMMESRISRWKSFLIIITNDTITRQFVDTPDKTIKLTEIKTLVKGKSGDLRINGSDDDGIWIPNDIESYEEIESIIQLHAEVPSDGSPIIKEEVPPETFETFFALLQKYFSGVSILFFLIILLSYLKIHLFYLQFNISIYNYLDASEILFQFTSLITECLVILIFLTVFHNTFNFIRIKKAKSSQSIWLIKSDIAYILIYMFMIFPFAYLYYTIPDTMIGEGNDNNHNAISLQIATLIFGFLSIYPIVVCLYAMSLYFIKRDRLVTLPLTFLALIVTFILVTRLENRMSYNLIVNGYPKYSITIRLSDGTTKKTSDSLIYIGSTKNYLFFRKPKEISNLIIPRTSIIEEEQSLLRIGL